MSNTLTNFEYIKNLSIEDFAEFITIITTNCRQRNCNQCFMRCESYMGDDAKPYYHIIEHILSEEKTINLQKTIWYLVDRGLNYINYQCDNCKEYFKAYEHEDKGLPPVKCHNCGATTQKI